MDDTRDEKTAGQPAGTPLISGDEGASGEPKERLAYMGYAEAVLLPVAHIAVMFVLMAFMFVRILIPAGFMGGVLGRDVGNPFAQGVPLGMQTLVEALGMTPVLAWCLWRSRERFPVAFALRRVPWGVFVALVPLSFGLTFLLSELDNVARALLPLPAWEVPSMGALENHPCTLFIASVIVGPLVSESLYRGAILGGLLRRHGMWQSITASSLICVLFHFNPDRALVILVSNVAFGLLYCYSKSLWPCIALDAFRAAIGFLVFVWIPEGIPGYSADVVAGQFQPLWLDAAAAIAFIIGLLLLWVSLPRKREPRKTPLEAGV